MRKCTLLLTLTISCGNETNICPDGSWTSDSFVALYNKTVLVTSEHDVCERQINRAIELTTSKFMQVFIVAEEQEAFENALNNKSLFIEISDGPIIVNRWGRVEGAYENYRIRYIYYPCVAYSVLVHEFTHMLLHVAGLWQVTDYSVSDNELLKQMHPEWIFANSNDSFVGELNEELKKEYCDH